MKKETRYTLVNKRGETIFSSNSFIGYIGGLIVTILGAFVIIMIIAAIFCGLGSLFK